MGLFSSSWSYFDYAHHRRNMAKLNYSLKRLEDCIFSVDENIKTPDDFINYYEIDESLVEKAWEERCLSPKKPLKK